MLQKLSVLPASKRLAEYRIFCEANALDVVDRNLVFWNAQLEEDSVAIRSRRLYLSQVRKLLCLLDRGGDVRIGARLVRALTVDSTTAPRRHARDLTDVDIQRLLNALWLVNRRVAVVGYAMWLTGMRFVDLTYCRRSQLVSTKRTFYVDVRRSKSIRSDWLRRELAVPLSCQPPTEARAIYHAELLSLAADDFIAPADNTSAFNRYLKAVWSAEEYSNVRLEAFGSSSPFDGRAPTTYTLRRAAFARFIEHYRSDEGIVNWDRAAKMSLHFKASTLQAFYYKGPPREQDDLGTSSTDDT